MVEAAVTADNTCDTKPLRVGLDIGSTTVKAVVLDQTDSLDAVLFSDYRRHHANVRATVAGLLEDIHKELEARGRGDEPIRLAITGSGGLALADNLHVPFVQEVIAETRAIDEEYPQADVIIELGGEDAKITYLKPTPEQRMNGSCAGGTGAFIDQMATLLDTDAAGLNDMAKHYETLYPIASRCGVFAKTDLQPLINDGAAKPDLAASIFTAVATQTIAGLASGRPIHGTVIFLGGPLFFMSELREAFHRALEGKVDEFIVPTDAHLYVAFGSALLAGEPDQLEEGQHFEARTCADILKSLEDLKNLPANTPTMPPLFPTEADREAFNKRHHREHVHIGTLEGAQGPHFLGIDAGSTTIKATLVNDDREIVWSSYATNEGSPLTAAVNIVKQIQSQLPEGAWIARSCATGYGEGLITTGLHLDEGVVETMAHYRGAEMVSPGVTAVIDIGGQDMKYLAISNGVIDSIAVNEACSSGCGSFLQTFAQSMGLTIQEFTQAALNSTHPVDLGSRCTVFMNSSVKQAQKEGADVRDISAGLSYSVVRNALYKVIKLKEPSDLGERVVVQGGTFLNDAILRSFEQEIGRNVTRPAISGLMGAYGAALHAKDNRRDTTTLIGTDILAGFEHNVRSTRCGLCENHCNLTINDFGGGRRFISGNRCERPLGGTKKADLPNLYKWKLEKLKSYGEPSGIANPIAKIGLPFGLNNFELLPFWTAFLRKLGFETVLSDVSTRDMYMQGQHSIPSDTVCYPAKLMHGHIENLLEKGVDAIFYPCMTYNLDEERATNHYNCPVVAYYPELLKANVSALADFDFMMPYFELADKKRFTKHAVKYFCGKYPQIKKKQVIAAVEDAYMAQDEYYIDVRIEGQRAIRYADEHDLDVAVIAGRPYHVDPEINHGIDQLIASFGLVIVSEDAVWQLTDAPEVHVLNQWTYHSRMYGAAKYVTQKENAQLIQLVSFGCGIDAITTDEMRAICENGGKIYTQLKIDEISNLGAAKIRIRSMLAAVEEGRKLAEQQNA